MIKKQEKRVQRSVYVDEKTWENFQRQGMNISRIFRDFLNDHWNKCFPPTCDICFESNVSEKNRICDECMKKCKEIIKHDI